MFVSPRLFGHNYCCGLWGLMDLKILFLVYGCFCSFYWRNYGSKFVFEFGLKSNWVSVGSVCCLVCTLFNTPVVVVTGAKEYPVGSNDATILLIVILATFGLELQNFTHCEHLQQDVETWVSVWPYSFFVFPHLPHAFWSIIITCYAELLFLDFFLNSRQI